MPMRALRFSWFFYAEGGSSDARGLAVYSLRRT
jgi:hypothetical protein